MEGELCAQARAAKELGNVRFGAGEFAAAADAYGDAARLAVDALRAGAASASARRQEQQQQGGSDSGAVSAAVAALPLSVLGQLSGLSAETNRELLELVPTALNNRSAALHKVGRFEEALADAEQALSLKPTWAKAHHRKGQALVGLGRLGDARDAYSLALDADPDNAFLKQHVEELDAKTGYQSAHAKIEQYIAAHGSVKGCPTKLSLSMFATDDVPLGEGNYSTVLRATFRKTGEVFALKVVDKTKVERMGKRNPNIKKEIAMEKRVLLKLNHPNVIKLFATMQDNSSLFFVQELAPGGELWARLCFGRDCLVALRPSDARFYVAQLINALDHLRRHGVVHRDVKPENMLLFPDAASGGRVEWLKLIDFGTAYDTVETDLNGAKFVGTPEYMSPEAIAAKADPTPALDVWAMGATLFQLNSGRIPFKGSSPYLTFLKTQALRYEMPGFFSDALQDLLRRMFVAEPSQRIGAEDEYRSLRAHAYFAGLDLTELAVRPVRPVPDLAQLCLEAVVGQFTVGTGNEARPAAAAAAVPTAASRAARAKLPAWAQRPGVFAPARIPARAREALLGMFGQRQLLGRPHVFGLFFESERVARFSRAAARAFVGLSENEQGKFRDPFLLAHLGSLRGATPQHVATLLRRMDKLQPAPKLLVLGDGCACGGDARAREALMDAIVAGLDERVPVVCCPCEPHESDPGYEARCGDRYFSLYCSGVMVIVVDSFLLARLAEPEPDHAAEQQAKWLEDEILRGKLTARHVIVVSHHAWALSQDGFLPGDRVLPLPVAQRFLDKLADSNGQLVLATGADRATFQKRPATNDNNTRIVMVTTPPVLHASSDKLSLRIVRVQTQEVVSDRYTLDELPPVIALDKEERPTHGGENGPDNEDQDKCFSDISSDSDQG